jgi:hypothetical protein
VFFDPGSACRLMPAVPTDAITGATSLSLPCSKKPANRAEFSNARRALSFCFAATPKLTNAFSKPWGRGGSWPFRNS